MTARELPRGIPLGMPGESKPVTLFVTILTAGTALVVTMAELLARFHGGTGEAVPWRAVIVVLAGAGVGLSLTAIIQLSLITSRRSRAASRQAKVEQWTETWNLVARGADVPVVHSGDHEVAAEAAALVLQELVGDGAERVRRALLGSGVIAVELAAAAQGMLSRAGAHTEALERLAWIAAPEALPLFEVAVDGSERAARAALLGAMRVLSCQRRPEDVGEAVMSTIEGYVNATCDPDGPLPYLTAVMSAAEGNLDWLCRELLGRGETPEVVNVAALDAMGRSQRLDDVSEVATAVLFCNAVGETKAAALRVLALVCHVPKLAEAAVVAAASDPHATVRVHAVQALVGAAPRVALPILWHALGDGSWEVRRAAAAALVRWGRSGEDLLRRAAARHGNKFARDEAAMVLGVPGLDAARDTTTSGEATAGPVGRAGLGEPVVAG